MTTPLAQDVLAFWFGTLDAGDQASAEYRARWWRKDPAFDAEIARRFGPLHAALDRGQHEDWQAEAESSLAAVIVLDQFSRNMFRGSPRSFASDARALALAEHALACGHDRALRGEQRVFLRMPLMHSESRQVQRRCVSSFEQLQDELPAGALRDTVAANVEFARKHLVIIERFGRFPHRNAVLGRTSSGEEMAFLEQPGSSF